MCARPKIGSRVGPEPQNSTACKSTVHVLELQNCEAIVLPCTCVHMSMTYFSRTESVFCQSFVAEVTRFTKEGLLTETSKTIKIVNAICIVTVTFTYILYKKEY